MGVRFVLYYNGKIIKCNLIFTAFIVYFLMPYFRVYSLFHCHIECNFMKNLTLIIIPSQEENASGKKGCMPCRE